MDSATRWLSRASSYLPRVATEMVRAAWLIVTASSVGSAAKAEVTDRTRQAGAPARVLSSVVWVALIGRHRRILQQGGDKCKGGIGKERQKAEGRRQKAEGRRQKAEG